MSFAALLRGFSDAGPKGMCPVPCLPPLFLHLNDYQLPVQPDLCGMFLKYREGVKETDSPPCPHTTGVFPLPLPRWPQYVPRTKHEGGTVNFMTVELNSSVSYPNTPAKPSLFQGQQERFFTQKPCISAGHWGVKGAGRKSQAQGKS